jgi:bifunctional non-homologous end joining protein LigD
MTNDHRARRPGRDRGPRSRRARAGTRHPAAGSSSPRAFAALVQALPGARPGALPRTPRPQLATLVAAPPAGPDWLHEIKFDGYRILARLERGTARLWSRGGKEWTRRFPDVAAAVARLPAREALLDGEVAAILPDGTTSFQALQNVFAGDEPAPVVYHVFDLPFAEGHDLTRVPLESRKDALRQLLRSAVDPLRYSDHVVGSGPEVYARACRLALEGIVSKRRDAPYEAARTRTWLKVKCARAQEVVIGGYTEPAGSRTDIGALLVGVHDGGGALRYAGKVGTGFTGATLQALRRRLATLAQARSPFSDRVPGAGRAHWVRPELVAEVAFTEWTEDGRLRHPSFKGLREDKAAAEVVRERPAAAGAVDAGAAPAAADAPRPVPRPPGDERARSRPGASGQGATDVVAGVRLTHADRVLYPEQGTTKRDLARFYESIADWVLPHLRGRPLTLVRCPEGQAKACFYVKHAGAWAPAALRRIRIQEKTKMAEYLVVDDVAGLVSLVQMGILEIHTWNSTAEHLETPDRLVFDLDPGPAVPWPEVIETARLVRGMLEAVGLESFVKTTGGKGLHVVVPLRADAGWEDGYEFSRRIAEEIVRRDPRRYTTEMPKAPRRRKILIDVVRNRRGNTSIAAYSTRARAGAPVSTPLGWDELTPSLAPDHYTIANLPGRLARLRADPWARYATLAQQFPGAGRPAERAGGGPRRPVRR